MSQRYNPYLPFDRSRRYNPYERFDREKEEAVRDRLKEAAASPHLPIRLVRYDQKIPVEWYCHPTHRTGYNCPEEQEAYAAANTAFEHSVLSIWYLLWIQLSGDFTNITRQTLIDASLYRLTPTVTTITNLKERRKPETFRHLRYIIDSHLHKILGEMRETVPRSDKLRRQFKKAYVDARKHMGRRVTKLDIDEAMNAYHNMRKRQVREAAEALEKVDLKSELNIDSVQVPIAFDSTPMCTG